LIKCQGRENRLQTKAYARLKGPSGVAHSFYLQLYGLAAGPEVLEKGIEKLAFSIEASADGILDHSYARRRCLFVLFFTIFFWTIFIVFGSAAQSSISFLDLAFARSSPVSLGDVSPAR